MIESPGYTVPGELTFTWVPGYVPVPKAVAVDEGEQTLSPEHPPPNPVPASAARPVVNSVTLEQFTESVRQTDRANVFVVEAAEGSPSTVVEPEPGQSPLVVNSMPGCQFRMTSYDD